MFNATISDGLIYYDDAYHLMQQKVKHIQEGGMDELWFLQHHDVYTAGTSANPKVECLDNTIPIVKTNRGGRITWHGPGQLIGYVMLNLGRQKKKDVRLYIRTLEQAIQDSLYSLDVLAEPRDDRIGLWVKDRHNPLYEAKIAAIGVRISKWVTWHGFSLNINPDLAQFNAIIPCGIHESYYTVTSLQQLGIEASFHDVAAICQKNIIKYFA